VNSSTFGRWFRSAPAGDAHLRIICFPFAGGGASVFHPWLSRVPRGVQICAVELPGRESRHSETLRRDMKSILTDLAPAVEPFIECPYALFGHSLGGILAFELARELRRRSMPLPIRFFASACRAPQLPSRTEPIHRLDNRRFLERLSRIAEISTFLRQGAEMVNLTLPILKADFEIAENYRYVTESEFLFPITALGGNQDKFVTAGDLVAWHAQTSEEFRLRLLAGGHLFLTSSPDRVIQTVLDEVGSKG
jgi:surfactin synthase thioesterase subunit